jgi:hypothetical protein
VIFRRRHQPKRPPLAKIKGGSPAPAMGAGTPTGGPLTGAKFNVAYCQLGIVMLSIASDHVIPNQVEPAASLA